MQEAGNDDGIGAMNHDRFAAETSHAFLLRDNTRDEQYGQGAQERHLNGDARAGHYNEYTNDCQKGYPGTDA